MACYHLVTVGLFLSETLNFLTVAFVIPSHILWSTVAAETYNSGLRKSSKNQEKGHKGKNSKAV